MDRCTRVTHGYASTRNLRNTYECGEKQARGSERFRRTKIWRVHVSTIKRPSTLALRITQARRACQRAECRSSRTEFAAIRRTPEIATRPAQTSRHIEIRRTERDRPVTFCEPSRFALVVLPSQVRSSFCCRFGHLDVLRACLRARHCSSVSRQSERKSGCARHSNASCVSGRDDVERTACRASGSSSAGNVAVASQPDKRSRISFWRLSARVRTDSIYVARFANSSGK